MPKSLQKRSELRYAATGASLRSARSRPVVPPLLARFDLSPSRPRAHPRSAPRGSADGSRRRPGVRYAPRQRSGDGNRSAPPRPAPPCPAAAAGPHLAPRANAAGRNRGSPSGPAGLRAASPRPAPPLPGLGRRMGLRAAASRRPREAPPQRYFWRAGTVPLSLRDVTAAPLCAAVTSRPFRPRAGCPRCGRQMERLRKAALFHTSSWCSISSVFAYCIITLQLTHLNDGDHPKQRGCAGYPPAEGSGLSAPVEPQLLVCQQFQ